MNQRFMVKRNLAFALCLIFGFVAMLGLKPDKALACSCAHMPGSEDSVKFALERDGVIFAGTVRQVEKPQNKWLFSSADEVKITMDVSEVWKGTAASSTVVYTAQSSASCGYEQFAVDKAYLVSAYDRGDSRLVTGLCDLTMPLAAADDPVSMLGDSYAPEHAVPKGKIDNDATELAVPKGKAGGAKDQAGADGSRAAILIAASVVLLFVAIVFLRRRGRRQ